MRSASVAFNNVVGGTHRIKVRVDLLLSREVFAQDIPIVDGQIRWDRTASIMAVCDVTIAASAVTALNRSKITPCGAELQIWYGVELTGDANADVVYDASGAAVLDAIADGDDIVSDSQISPSATGFLEFVSLGVFQIQSVDIDGVTQEMLVSGTDRGQLVSDARFEEDYSVAAGTNYVTAITDMVDDGVNDVEYVLPVTVHTTPTLTFAAEDDRWRAAQDMAGSIGHELLWDGLGRLVMRPEPTVADEPVATITETINMVDAGAVLDRFDVYNRVIVVARNASNDDVYRGVATDTDTSSSSQYGGDFGKKPLFVYSEFIASDDQAEIAASAILAAHLGEAQTIWFEALPDPRLETGDAVRITNTLLGVDEIHLIDEMVLGLTADQPMQCRTRTNQGVPS